MFDTPLVTIIVVTHNSARFLPRLCAAVAKQSEARWRLLVIDNGSRADERPRQGDLPPNASLIQSEINLGFAEANNLAARDADTPYLVFLNPDAFPEPDWLSALLATAERFPRAGAIGSTQLRADTPGVYDGVGDVLHVSGMAYRAGYGRRLAYTPQLGEPFSACAAAMLVRRAAVEEVGCFDERYFCYFEDVDLCFRLRLAGWRVVQTPDAVVAHVGGGVSGTRSAFADFHGARNRVWTFLKCMPPVLFWLMLLPHLVLSALAVTAAALRGRGLAAWRGFVAGLSDTHDVLQTRRRVQRARKTRTLDIAGAMTWSPDVLITRRPVLRRPKA